MDQVNIEQQKSTWINICRCLLYFRCHFSWHSTTALLLFTVDVLKKNSHAVYLDTSFLFLSIQDEALSPQSQLSPVSVCSESSGFSVISTPAKKAPKRTNQTTRGEAASITAHLLIQLSSIFVCFVKNQGKFCTALWVCRILGFDQPNKEW